MEHSNQTPQTQEVQTQMPSSVNNSSQSKVVPIILDVATVAIIAIGAYFLGSKQSQLPAQNSVQTTPIPSPIPTIDETANWKIYVNRVNNYSLKYPSEITLEEKDNSVSLKLWGPTQKSEGHFLDGILLQFSSGPLGNKSLKEFVDMQVEESKELGSEIIAYPTSIIIDGATGYKYTLTGAGNHTKIYLPYKTQGYILIINGTADPTAKGFQNTVDQILATFKFTDQTNLTPDQIFSEAASQLGLTRSQLNYFRIFGQDKIQYSFGSGTNFAYKYANKWQIAGGKDTQEIRNCTELNNVPEQYRPVCLDTVTGKEKYMDIQRQSLNYPTSQMTSYIGE